MICNEKLTGKLRKLQNSTTSCCYFFRKLKQNRKSDDDAVHKLCSQRYKVQTVKQVQILMTCPVCEISAVYNQRSGKTQPHALCQCLTYVSSARHTVQKHRHAMHKISRQYKTHAAIYKLQEQGRWLVAFTIRYMICTGKLTGKLPV